MSSYAHRLRLQGRPVGIFAVWIDAVAWVVFRQREHCLKAFEAEAARKQFPPELR
jgi:hypothetical protein